MAGKPRVANPSDPVLWCKEAAERIRAQDTKAAILCYEEALRLRADVPDVWYNLGLLLETAGQRPAALRCHTKSAEMFPLDLRFCAERARLLSLEGKFTAALSAVDNALAIQPHSPALLANKAGYLVRAGDAAGAVAAADAALALDAANAAAFVNKANALMVIGDRVAAEASLRAGRAALPGDERITRVLANLLVRQEQFSEAVALTDEVLLTMPDDAEVWSLKGAALAYLGRKEEAVSAFERAMKIDPKEKSYRANRDAIRKS